MDAGMGFCEVGSPSSLCTPQLDIPLSAALEKGQFRGQGLLQAVSYGLSGQSPAGHGAKEWLLALDRAFQLGHSLLQVLHNEVHVSPGGTAAHAEPDCIPGHVHGNATAQQHWGWPAEAG